MYEDYYSDDDEKVNQKIQVYYFNNLFKILNTAKGKIKDYYKINTHISQKDLNKLYEGEKNTTITLLVNKFEPNNKTFDYLTKNRSNLPSIIYLTVEQIAMLYDYKRERKNLKITFSEKQLSDTLKEVKRINKKIDSLFVELKDIKDDFNILVKREYDNFISRLM